MAERFGIGHLLHRSIFHLSGGQKQRIAVAAATMLGPRLVVLDEPTSNLDANAIADMRAMIEQMKDEGLTIVIAEHRLAWLNGVADRYVVFDGGHIVQDYEADEFCPLPRLRGRHGIAGVGPATVSAPDCYAGFKPGRGWMHFGIARHP